MSDKDKKLKLNLDFLGEGVPKKSEKKHELEHKKQEGDARMSDATKLILGAIGVAVLIIIIAVSSGGNSDSTATTNILQPPANTEKIENIFDTLETENSYVPVVKTGLQICQERNGYNATYDSASNSCGCAIGYSIGATSQQCVSFVVARDQSCAASYPGTSFLKVDSVNGKNTCDCVAGSYWNNERTACYTIASFSQSCEDSYGTGSYSYIQEVKRVCGCGYGYDWNIERNFCVTTASINILCERDVGRDSWYSGTVADGKYQCTEPY